MNLIFKDIQLVIDLLNEEVVRLEKMRGHEINENPIVAVQEYTKSGSLLGITDNDEEMVLDKFDRRIEYIRSVAEKFQNEVDKASFNFSLRQNSQTDKVETIS